MCVGYGSGDSVFWYQVSVPGGRGKSAVGGSKTAATERDN